MKIRALFSYLFTHKHMYNRKVLLRNLLKRGTKHFKKIEKYVIMGENGVKYALDFSAYEQFTSRQPFDFSKHSSIGCGGTAPIAFYPQSVEELIALVEKLTKDGVRYYVLGNLTNVLPPDEEVDFAVVSTKRLNAIAMGDRVFASVGVTSGALLRACKHAMRSGAEFLSGIPCTLGGALYMNAGAGGKYISEIVENVLVLREGERHILSVEDCLYSYKKSVFMANNDIILGASLALEHATGEQVQERENFYLQRRWHLPQGRSMGCIFKNPPEKSAGALIEGCGLKGMRVGGAQISIQHANFIINDRKATSADIQGLISLIKNAVYSQYGICLEEEIRYLR